MDKQDEKLEQILRESGRSLQSKTNTLLERDFSRRKRRAIDLAVETFDKPKVFSFQRSVHLPAFALAACAAFAFISISSRNHASTSLSFEESQFASEPIETESLAFNISEFSDDFGAALSEVSLSIEPEGLSVDFVALNIADINENESWEDYEYEDDIEDYL